MSTLNPNAQLWVEALRSGKYTQAIGTLCVVTGDALAHCCLGVACEVFMESGGTLNVWVDGETESRRYNGESMVLPKPVMEWLGLRHNEGAFKEDGSPRKSLSGLNDSGIPFPELSDLIESQPEGLFAQ